MMMALFILMKKCLFYRIMQRDMPKKWVYAIFVQLDTLKMCFDFLFLEMYNKINCSKIH